MPHVSAKKIKKETLNKLYSQFGRAFEKSASRAQTKFFMGDFLTKTEKVMFAKRFAVICLLSKELPISYIAESLSMSYSTIFRMSRKYDIGKYSSLLGVIKKEEPDIWKILDKIVRMGLPPRAGRGRWKFLYKHF